MLLKSALKQLAFVVVVSSAAIVAAVGIAAENDSTGAAYETEKDIFYLPGDVADVDPYAAERCRLDVYYPKDASGFATVVWFHGGGLKAGNRSVPGALKKQGIAVVAVNYRLYPKVKCPVYLQDAAAAVAWTFKNIKRFGGDPTKIYVSGHSAGGYLTSMVGLDKRWLAAYDVDADRIAGLIPFSGHTITHMTVRAERGISDKQPIVDEFAPLYHVRPDAPPIFLMTGDREKEMLGRYEENAYFMRMLKVAGHKDVTLIEFPGYGHGMSEPAFPELLKFIRARESQTTKEHK